MHQYSVISGSLKNCCLALQHAAEHTYALKRTYTHMLWKHMHLSSLLTCRLRSITVGGRWMNVSPRQRPPIVAEHIVRMYSLWPESFPCWINHDKANQPYAGLLFYLLSCPSSEYALEKLQKKTREEKKKNMDTSPQEVVRNHCFHGNGRQQ